MTFKLKFSLDWFALKTQRAQIWGPRHQAVFDETRERYRKLKRGRKTRLVATDSFERTVMRLQLTEEDLQRQFRKFRAAHWGLYLFALLLLFYSEYSLVGASAPSTAFVALTVGICSAVQGYIQGYRALQIQLRKFIPLSAALRHISTYLVI